MNLTSVSGKNWIYKKFDSSDIIKFTEKYSLSETVAKLLSIRKKSIDNIDLFLNPKIKNLLPNPFESIRNFQHILNYISIHKARQATYLAFSQ